MEKLCAGNAGKKRGQGGYFIGPLKQTRVSKDTWENSEENSAET